MFSRKTKTVNCFWLLETVWAGKYTSFTDFFFLFNSSWGRVTHRSLFANCSDLLSLCFVLHSTSPRNLSKWLNLFLWLFFPFLFFTHFYFLRKMVLLVSGYTWICHSNFHILVLSNLGICTWWSTILVDWSQYFTYRQSCYHDLPHLFSEVFQESVPGCSLVHSTY